jgi:voltage-gated potassium channel
MLRAVAEHQLKEHVRTLARSAAFIVVVYAVGVIGFLQIGGEEATLMDAVFMTAITLTTVGYSETIDVSATSQAAMFTTMLMFAGVGSFVYFFSGLTAFMVEGGLDRLLWRRKMKRTIENLSGHFIVCGGGTTGAHIVGELLHTERPFVLIEENEDRARALFESFGLEFATVIGDATDDESLAAARVERASGLAACLSSDKDNLLVTVSGKMLNPKMRIVSRCTEDRVEGKIKQAGASAVVSPNLIGGLRMVSELVRPTAVSFLDRMLRDKDKRLRVEEHQISDRSKLKGSTVGSLRARKIADLLVMAVGQADGSWTYNPEDDTGLEPGMSVIFMGSPAARTALEAVDGTPTPPG